MELFRVRLNCIDHYQASPSDFDPSLPVDQTQTYKVPVIRVFGATETGQKVCAHIHGFFPYLYVECDEEIRNEPIEAYVQRLRLSIDHALAVSYRRDLEGSKKAFVANISLVKGIPFYGYHVGYRVFCKIYLLNPLHITRLADLLRQGAIMSRSFQPFESHMQYVPQWMCDYNLYGCSYLDCSEVKFRLPIPRSADTDTDMHKWHDGSIPDFARVSDAKICRQSHCALEVDVCVADIMNRHAVSQRNLHNDFSEAINIPNYQQKLVPSMESLWRDESKRRREKMGITNPDSSPFPPEVLVSVSAEARGDSGQWIHEEEFRGIMDAAAKKERLENPGSQATYHDFVKPDAFLDSLPSAFESIEDFYDERMGKRASFQPLSQHDVNETQYSTVDVDEDRILAIIEGRDADATGWADNAENGPSKLGPRGDVNATIRDQPSSNSASSSADLANMGIHGHGDYSRMAEDAFIVPDDFTSEISAVRTNHNYTPKRTSATERPAKRLKTSAAGRSGPLHTLGIGKRLADVQGNQLLQNHDALPSSQPGSVSGSQRSGKLPFPVVKGPQQVQQYSQKGRDKGTASQCKSSTTNSEKTEETKSVSFDTSERTVTPSRSTIPPTNGTPKPFSWIERDLDGFDIQLLCLDIPPPSTMDVKHDLASKDRANILWQNPYYSAEEDVPLRKFQYGGREFFVGGITTPYLPEFDPLDPSLCLADDQPAGVSDRAEADKIFQRQQSYCSLQTWEIAIVPPSRLEVESWLVQESENINDGVRRVQKSDITLLSQVETASQKHQNGFKYSQQKDATTSVKHETQYMSVMSLEIHVNTRGTFVPNPEQDPVCAIFWSLQGSEDAPRDSDGNQKPLMGAIVLSETGGLGRKVSQMTAIEVAEEKDELDLLNNIVDVVRRYDPDVLAGFEVHGGSWGYVIERARHKYDANLCDDFARTKSDAHGRFGRESDRWGFNQTSTIRVTGRHMINIWRAMRVELNLLQYTMENIVFHLLQRRVPHYSFQDLTRWWKSTDPADVAKTVRYFVTRAELDLEILEKNELVPRTSEQARLLGVDFFSVFSRGSQFKVESLMFRIAKPENFILISPSRKQVGQQNALECLPLVMEPQSAFYNSPLLVLDFQSLYPSVMIAYNYCYSTFLGRINNWRGGDKMGFADYRRQARLLDLLKDHVNISPNGMMYVKPHIRKSLLAKMLGEILETRVMVKSGMKVDKEDKPLQRLLHNRQLALKFIANVTYGYTSASFSGRMPCSEIADSIVQTGRETLEKAIALIHSKEKWGAEVVYGDTDSVFVYLKGKSKAQAFDIGEEIADAITEMNPKPIKLKFEKVYHPCVLLAKKRYVGFKYESRNQKEPEFDAKGIETVRRDGTPAEQKIEEKALKLLFQTQDLSQVKSYFQRQCSKIMRGKVSLQDFCFAREVKLGTYSDKGPPPPGALISTRKMLVDPRAEPQYGERVPYLVITGAPGARLIDRCVAPEVLLQNEHLELDADYYISKNLIPPLERIFNLIGANVRSWYDEMPKVQRIRRIENALATNSDYDSGPERSTRNPGAAGTDYSGFGREGALSKKTMESYMKSASCIVCRDNKVDAGTGPVCSKCLKAPHLALLTLRTRINEAEKKAVNLEKVCRSCSGLKWGEEVRCDSKDCPVFYARTRHSAGLRGTRAVTTGVIRTLNSIEREDLEW